MNIKASQEQFNNFRNDFSKFKKIKLSIEHKALEDPPFVAYVIPDRGENKVVCGYFDNLERDYFIVNAFQGLLDSADKCIECKDYVTVHDSFKYKGGFICQNCVGKLIRKHLPYDVRPVLTDYIDMVKLDEIFRSSQREAS